MVANAEEPDNDDPIEESTPIHDFVVDKDIINDGEELPAHWKNEDMPRWVRLGLPIYLVSVMALLLASDLGSGVEAITQTVANPELGIAFESDPEVILEASVFTSVKELWDAGSYALAIFIVLTSISWPYIKLLLTLFAWMTPFTKNPARREQLLVWVDALGKWSFVDIVVFIEIVVVFRATIPVGAGNLEVWIVPQWGLFGFVSATMLSLLGTHATLYLHRNVMKQYSLQQPPQSDNSPGDLTGNSHDAAEEEGEHNASAPMQTPDEDAMDEPKTRTTSHGNGSDNAQVSLQNLCGMQGWKTWWISFLLLFGFCVYLTGCIIHVFEVTNIQQKVRRTTEDYSIVSVGTGVEGSFREGDEGKERYMQVIWFLLGVVLPLISTLLVAVLFWMPFSSLKRLEQWYFGTEVFLAWSCGEVYFISTLFAVTSMPKFGDGLVETGCHQCYAVESEFYAGAYVVWGLGVASSLSASIYVLVLGHKVLFGKEARSTQRRIQQ